jgi:hypothetical protein
VTGSRLVGLFRLVSINAAVLLVLLELVGMIKYFVDHRSFFYFRHRDSQGRSTAAAPLNASLPNWKLHPYFGYVVNPRLSLAQEIPPQLIDQYRIPRDAAFLKHKQRNNYGFATDGGTPYPAGRTQPDEYVVGVFGGSVAYWFSLLGEEAFVSALAQLPQLAGRRIRILDFAASGYKQPQQLLVLTYFLSLKQPLDLVVNLDGVNEIILTADGHKTYYYDVSMPSYGIQLLIDIIGRGSSMSVEGAELYARLARTRERINWLEEREATTRSSALWLLYKLGVHSYGATNRRLQIQHVQAGPSAPADDPSPFVEINKDARLLSDETVLEMVANRWANASVMMHELCRANGIRYLHVLQPSFYYHARDLPTAAVSASITTTQSIGDYIKNGYPLLLNQRGLFESRGVRFADATEIFSDSSEVVYTETIHYTQYGNVVLARFIARQVGALLNSARP